MNPTVDVLTLTYNQEYYLPGLFESIINQTYRPLRLVLINDCSTDNSHNIILSLLPKLGQAGIQYTYVEMPENTKSIGAFDEGRNNLIGEYTAFLEGDDYYKPTKIEESINFLQTHKQFVMMHTEIDTLHEDGSYRQNFWKSLGINQGGIETTYAALLGDNKCHTCTIVVESKIFLQTPSHADLVKRGYVFGDYPCWLWIRKRYAIGYLDKSLSVYRVIATSKSHNASSRGEFVASTIKMKADAANDLL